ncbi:sensor histidine kinase [Thalassotalea euphylliae]|uniref:histidine kinase n=1 Tax=Thalassotalea euphylliae TaxID=1655234 RepID=A0A3E0TT11_9GAMM|nr:sensor histidine kinase [Thalassotalea euphylliae]REL27487.1 sensor histidine kinase [Thalassotalea euphylliae]
MKLKLFWKIYLSIALTSVALVTGLAYLNERVERQMSYIAAEDQQVLKDLAKQASQLIADNPEQLAAWIDTVQQQHNTWATVVRAKTEWLDEGEISRQYIERISLGRPIRYPIHLEHKDNPMMGLPLAVEDFHLLILLPQDMRPGQYWQLVHWFITLLLPLLLVALLSYVIYRHIIKPIEALHTDTTKFRAGNFDTRTSVVASNRRDEIGELAVSFNHMADSIDELFRNQRQLIADISHELRTPITRLRLTIDSEYPPEQLRERVEREVTYMTGLVEDTLTLAWLENEKPTLNQEDVDLIALIESIAEDARFEFPNHPLVLHLPNECIVKNSYHRALGQSIENIVRNAMKYTPITAGISIRCYQQPGKVLIEIEDQGPGVPEAQLTDIFKPFVRLDKSRDRDSGGYGLGLALAKRQISAIGGSLTASNNRPHGLVMTISLNT